MLTNDETGDSFSLASLSNRPSGANIVFTSDTSDSTSKSYSGTASFPSGWTAVFTRSDITIDYPNTGGTQTTYKTISFAQPIVSTKKILASNPTSNHPPANPATNVTFGFDVTTTNTTLGKWSVDIEKDGHVVRTLPVENDPRGPGSITAGNPAHVSLIWDGRDSTNTTVDGNFTWVATAYATTYVGGAKNDGVNSSQTTLDDSNDLPPTLEILGVGPGGPPQGLLSFDIDSPAAGWREYQRFLGAYVFPYNRLGQNNTLTIHARNIPSTSPPGANRPPLKLKVYSQSSGGLSPQGTLQPAAAAAREVDLAWNSSQKYYESTLQLDSSLIVDNYLAGGTGVTGTTCFMERAYLNYNWPLAIISGGTLTEPAPARQGAYPSPVQLLGECRRSFGNNGGPSVFAGPPRQGKPSGILANPTLAYPTADNLLDFGHEPVLFQINSSGVNLYASLKVRHPAPVVALNVHGGRDGSLSAHPSRLQLLNNGQLITNGFGQPGVPADLQSLSKFVEGLTMTELPPSSYVSVVPGTDATAESLKSVRTLILQSCDALDHLDYNNNSFSDPNSANVTTRLAELGNPPGGDRWLQATSQGHSISGGHTILLGYNRIVSNDWSLVTQNYQSEYLRLKQAGVADKDLEIWAWMSANLNYARNVDTVGQNALAACAWDGDYYYYIRHGRLKDQGQDYPPGTHQLDWVNLKDLGTRRTVIYRIPKAKWLTAPKKWTDVPQFAQMVTIP